MTYKITHKNSTVSGTPPTAGDIDVGEIAINAADAELYTKDTNGNIRKFQNTATGTADGVHFTQAGTGAVTRTVDSKLKDVVSVKDFGAVGNGVTEDTAAIQSAIDAVNSGGGGVVYLPKGDYLVGQINLKSNVSLFGEGKSSALKVKASGGDQTYGLVASNQSNITVSDLRVYGTGLTAASLTTAVFFTDGSTYCTVRDCYIDTCFLGALIGNVSTTSASNCSIINNTITNIGLNGAGVNSFGTGNRIDNNLIVNFGQIATPSVIAGGIEYRGAIKGSCSGNIIKNGAYGSTPIVDGIRIEFATEGATQAPSGVIIANNTIDNVSGFGIRAQFIKNCVITGNTIQQCWYGPGIAILSNFTGLSQYVTCSNNTIKGVLGGRAIYLEGTAGYHVSHCSIASNTITNCTDDGITISYARLNVISSNTIANNTAVGIRIVNGDKNLIQGNLIAQNHQGMVLLAGDKNSIAANTIIDNTSYGIAMVGATNTLIFGGEIGGNTPNTLDTSGTTTGIISSSSGLSFFGASPGAKRTVTGSRSGNVALNNLLNALSDYGIITNSTTP